MRQGVAHFTHASSSVSRHQRPSGSGTAITTDSRCTSAAATVGSIGDACEVPASGANSGAASEARNVRRSSMGKTPIREEEPVPGPRGMTGSPSEQL